MPAPLGRLMTAMVTPFDANGEVDLEQTKVLAKALVASGTEGIVATGSTGEAASMDDDETIAVWRATKEAVGPDIAVIAGATSNNLRRSIKLTQAAEREGLDGARELALEAFTTFVAQDDEAQPTPVPPLRLDSDADRACYDEAVQRRARRLAHAGR